MFIKIKIMKILILVILHFVLHFTLFSQDSIFGNYKNNIAVFGFFGEDLTLNKDSTFTYCTGGDMVYKYGKGNFVIRGKKLTLLFHRGNYENIDSLIATGKITQHASDSIYKEISAKYNIEKLQELSKEESKKLLIELDQFNQLNIIDCDSIQDDSLNFIIRKKKLLCINQENGKIIRRVKAFSKIRKFIFW